jgi:hypothetical protein
MLRQRPAVCRLPRQSAVEIGARRASEPAAPSAPLKAPWSFGFTTTLDHRQKRRLFLNWFKETGVSAIYIRCIENASLTTHGALMTQPTSGTTLAVRTIAPSHHRTIAPSPRAPRLEVWPVHITKRARPHGNGRCGGA